MRPAKMTARANARFLVSGWRIFCVSVTLFGDVFASSLRATANTMKKASPFWKARNENELNIELEKNAVTPASAAHSTGDNVYLFRRKHFTVRNAKYPKTAIKSKIQTIP